MRISIRCAESLKLIFLIIFTTIVGFKAYSQKYFLPGYLLLKNGDTIHGEILDQDPYRSSQSVIIRANENETEVVFTPLDLTSYYLSNNKYYESRIFDYYRHIPIDTIRKIVYTKKENPERSAFEKVKDTLLLRVIVKGDAKLFETTDVNGTKLYFVETPGCGLKQLIKIRTYYPKKNGRIGFKTKNSIIDTLQSLTYNCDQNLYFEKRNKFYLIDIIDYVMDYNSCIDSESKIIQPKQRVKVKFGINFGINYTNIISNEYEDIYIEQAKYNTKQGLLSGIAIDWYLNNPKEKWIFQTELCYSQSGANTIGYNTWVYYYGNPRDTNFLSKQYEIDVESINLGILGKYFLNQKHRMIRPYLSGGMVFGTVINRKTTYKVTNISHNYESEYYLYQPTVEIGIIGKAGLLINAKDRLGFYLEFRSSYSRLIQNEIESDFKSTLYNLTIGMYL